METQHAQKVEIIQNIEQILVRIQEINSTQMVISRQFPSPNQVESKYREVFHDFGARYKNPDAARTALNKLLEIHCLWQQASIILDWKINLEEFHQQKTLFLQKAVPFAYFQEVFKCHQLRHLESCQQFQLARTKSLSLAKEAYESACQVDLELGALLKESFFCWFDLPPEP